MSEKYINKAQQRIIELIFLLAGHELEGCAPGELAKALDANPALMTSDLRNLLKAGAAERMESGRWRLTPRMARVGMSILDNLSRQEKKLIETKQQFTRIH